MICYDVPISFDMSDVSRELGDERQMPLLPQSPGCGRPHDQGQRLFFSFTGASPLMVRGEQSGRSTGGYNIQLDIIRTWAGAG